MIDIAADVVDDVDVPELRALRAALDALTALDARVLADGDAVVALQRELSRAEALACRQAAAFDIRKDWRDDGAQTATAWIATRTLLARRHAGRRVRLGRAVDAMEQVDAAFRAGAISIDHVDLLAAARSRSRATAVAFGRDERLLVRWASTEVFAEFRRKLDQWLVEADHDDAEDRATQQRSRRRLHLSQSFENLWFADAVLDPVDGEILNDALRRITDELFDQDWQRTKAALGRKPSGTELGEHTRTPAQRRVDALVEMARRAGTVPAGGRAPQPLFTILVGEQSFARACELASGTIVTPGAVARWLPQAIIERVVFDGPDRVIAVSHRRTFDGALRRAIQVRDRRCAHRYCDKPAVECEVDHIEPWALGGATSLGNGRPYCEFHNLLRNGPGG